MLEDLRSCGSSVAGKAPRPERRGQCPVAGMMESAREESRQRFRQRIEPVGREAVEAQRFVLSPESVELDVVDCEPEAPDTPQGIAGELRHKVEGTLGQ